MYNTQYDISKVPKTRLITGLALIAMIMHKKLSLSELSTLVGVDISKIINALQGLIDLKLIDLNLNENLYYLLNEEEAMKYLMQIGFIKKA